ncbi:alpha/beta hydrolase [Gaetbulibacter aestuarii]|uniref:Alpha/beta hydrolase n=1 Tax=Gaetbulibacter aestuarii TaxID=1502358 RepID=A0ABW7MXF9_9FLAO
MSQELIHVYLMPGMAASPKIFQYIDLPKKQFEIHLLEWMIPTVNESLKDYAKRMSKHIKHDDIVLLGVSFGGVLVQEMLPFVSVKKLIIVSSVKCTEEIPPHMILAKNTKAYKLLPTQLASNVDVLAKYAIGKGVKKRLELYKTYLTVSDHKYLSWAIEKMVNWEHHSIIPGIIHIHGDRDSVFPMRYIGECYTIEGGTHTMILNKYRWFNTHLPKIILD